jgi:hypothetical protein
LGITLVSESLAQATELSNGRVALAEKVFERKDADAEHRAKAQEATRESTLESVLKIANAIRA